MDTTQTEIISFSDLMTGGMPLSFWFALLIFYMIGATIYQGSKVKKGIKTKPGSPNKFNPRYFFADIRNWIDFIVATLSAFIFIRFADKFLGDGGIQNNIEWLLFCSVVLGITWQLLADKLMDFSSKFFSK
jgi:hypothetical protein